MLLLFPVSHLASDGMISMSRNQFATQYTLLLPFLGTKTTFFLLYVHVSWHCRFKLTQKTKMTWNGCWKGEKKHHRMHRCDRFSQKTNWMVREPRHAGLFILLDSDFVQISSLKFEPCCAIKTGVSHIFFVKAAWLILSRMVRDQLLQLFTFTREQTTHLIFTTLSLWLELSLL